MAVLASGCGETIIDLSKTEDQIEAEVEAKRGEAVSSVDCPSDVEVDPGATFQCTVRLEDGGTGKATLRIRDDEANLTFVSFRPSK